MSTEESCLSQSAAVRESLEKILVHFGLKLLEVRTCRKIWMLNTSDGYKYLKRSRLTAEDLRFIDQALEYLHSRAFTAAPRFIHSLRGEPFAETDGSLYILTDWIFSEEMNFRSPDDLREAAGFLARFHYYSRGFIPKQANYRTCWLAWPDKLATRIEQLLEFQRMALAEKEKSPFSRLFLQHFAAFFRPAIQSYQNLMASPYREVASVAARSKSFCHHDYSDRNLLKTPRQGIFLVDFDYCCRDLRIHDLINFMTRLLKHRSWDIEYCTLILKEYSRIIPLAPEEIAVMLPLLQWPQDFWQVGLQYYCEKLAWPPERFWGKLENIIKTQAARRNFLGDFPRQNGICRL